MADAFHAYREEDDEAILEAYRTLSRDDFKRRAASIARDRGVPTAEVEARAQFLHKEWKKTQGATKSNGVIISSPQTRSSPRGRKSTAKLDASSASSYSSSSSGLTPIEEEFAMLTEEYFLAHPNATKKLAFWFIELHASSDLSAAIDEKKESMKEHQWKKSGKLSLFVRKSKKDVFEIFKADYKRQLLEGFRRPEMEDVLPNPGEEEEGMAEEGDRSVSFLQDAEDEFDVTDVFPPQPIDIKPRHKRGDMVFAAWIDNLVEEGELSWFPGTVKGYNVTERRGHYGEGRTYHIEFDDGDVDHKLKDIYVMSRKDYYLTENGVTAGKKSGITKIAGVGDEYAETVGWYKTAHTGEEVFGLLSDAVKARDEKVVDKKGQYVTEADLLFPQDWDFPEEFASRTPIYTGRGKIEFDDDADAVESPQRTSPATSSRRQRSFRDYDTKTDDEESPRRTPRSNDSGQNRKLVIDRTRSAKRSQGGENGGRTHKRQRQERSEDTTMSSPTRAANQSEADLLRFDLAVAHRLCSKFGFGILSQSHLSARYESDCLICELPTVWSSINPDNISVNPTEIDAIHHGIYSSREDVNAIIHLKSPAATAVSCLKDGFQFLSYDSAPFHKKLTACDCRGDAKAVSENIGTAVSSTDGCNTVLLQNNGFVCFGPSIRDAWFLAHRFEECCKLQLEVMKSGGQVRHLTDDDFQQATESGLAAQNSAPACNWDDLSDSVMVGL